jgi:hypothetical protein
VALCFKTDALLMQGFCCAFIPAAAGVHDMARGQTCRTAANIGLFWSGFAACFDLVLTVLPVESTTYESVRYESLPLKLNTVPQELACTTQRCRLLGSCSGWYIKYFKIHNTSSSGFRV